MDKKLEKQLSRKYSFLRPSQDPSIVKSNIKKMMSGHIKKTVFIHDLMVFGIECSDGWYDLIDSLCGTIQNIVSRENLTDFKVDQVKSKYAGLRFYTHGGNDEIEGAISLAEDLSMRICEICGDRGVLYSSSKRGGWYWTFCPKHAKEMKCFKVRR